MIGHTAARVLPREHCAEDSLQGVCRNTEGPTKNVPGPVQRWLNSHDANAGAANWSERDGVVKRDNTCLAQNRHGTL